MCSSKFNLETMKRLHECAGRAVALTPSWGVTCTHLSARPLDGRWPVDCCGTIWEESQRRSAYGLWYTSTNLAVIMSKKYIKGVFKDAMMKETIHNEAMIINITQLWKVSLEFLNVNIIIFTSSFQMVNKPLIKSFLLICRWWHANTKCAP